MCTDKNLTQNMLDRATLSQPLHVSFCRLKNSVHILKSEESYVNYLLLKSVKNEFLWGKSMHL